MGLFKKKEKKDISELSDAEARGLILEIFKAKPKVAMQFTQTVLEGHGMLSNNKPDGPLDYVG